MRLHLLVAPVSAFKAFESIWTEGVFMFDEFYRVTKDWQPSDLLVRAVSYAPQKGEALDLGCGAGRDTRFLLAQGFTVTAVDANEATPAYLRELPQDRLQIVWASFEEFQFASYDLVNASC